MNFEELMLLAKQGDSSAINELIRMYQPLMMKAAIIEGTFDEDLYQELTMLLIHCINKKV